jgi:hypothetical protein
MLQDTSTASTGLSVVSPSAILKWAYTALSEAEGKTLRGLAVFQGSFSMASAVAVVGGEELNATDVAGCIRRLVNQAFINVEVGYPAVRYRLPNVIRRCAFAELKEREEYSLVRLVHARHMQQRVTDEAAQDNAISRADCISACGRSIEDVRFAIDWALGEGGDLEAGVRLTAAAVPIGDHLSLLEEFRERVDIARAKAVHIEPRDSLLEMRLHIACAALTNQTYGPGTGTSRQAIERALELAEEPTLDACKGEALNAAMANSFLEADYEQAAKYAQAFTAHSREHRDAAGLLVADKLLAQARHFEGRHEEAEVLAERVVGHPSRVDRLSSMQNMALHRRVSLGIILARLNWIQGRVTQARELAEECLEAAKSDVGYSLCQALALASCPLALWTGDRDTARKTVELLRQHSARLNVGYWRRWGDTLNMVLDQRDAHDLGQPPLSSARALLTATDDKLADMLLTVGAFYPDDRAIDRADQGRCGWCAAEIYRTRADWLLQQDSNATKLAYVLYEKSLKVAREQGAVSWELRTAISLSRLLCTDFRGSEAKQLMQTVYGRFADGFETADLVEARKMLEHL